MASKISGLRWGNSYQNPDMPPEVAMALAERGFNPDGSRMTTQQRLDALNGRISQDWQRMSFDPPPPRQTPDEDIFTGANSPFANTGPDPFGAETRGVLAAGRRKVDAGYDRTMAVVDALLAGQRQPRALEMAQDRPQPSRATTLAAPSERPAQRRPEPATRPPKPTGRPAPETHTVRKGDNPSSIARRHGMTLQELEAKNPGLLKRARRLKPGSKVRI